MNAFRLEVRRHGVGYAAEGQAFYTWDVEAETLVSWASTLHEAARPAAPGDAPDPAPGDDDQKRNV